jgi:hypothetical protein
VDPRTEFGNRSALAGQDANRWQLLWTEPRVLAFLARDIFKVQNVTPRVPLNPCFSIYSSARNPKIHRITDKPLHVHNWSSMKLKHQNLFILNVHCRYIAVSHVLKEYV